MPKILHDRLQHYVNWELPDVQTVFRKVEEPEIKFWFHILCILEKAREFQKNNDLCFIKYTKAFDGVYHNKVWNILEMGLPDQFTCLLRNLYAGLETTEYCIEQLTCSGLRKEYYKVVYSYPVLLLFIFCF